jgi:hypothetical protein
VSSTVNCQRLAPMMRSAGRPARTGTCQPSRSGRPTTIARESAAGAMQNFGTAGAATSGTVAAPAFWAGSP